MKQIGIIAVIGGLFLILKGIDAYGPDKDNNSMQFLGLFIFFGGAILLTISESKKNRG